MSAAKEFSQLGPDCESLHTLRPYFVLPIPILNSTSPDAVAKARLNDDYSKALDRTRTWIEKPGPQYSDVYILSHGWHRNYYSAVSSYDRLISRMTRLALRQRLPQPPAYNPLFLCVHWSSEVGKDVWVDLSGRRDKQDYLRIARERFDDGVTGFQNLMEDAFEFFSAVSAPDAQIDRVLTDKSKEIAASFLTMRLREEPVPTDNEKMLPSRIAAAWSCYHESIAKGVRGTQKTKPQPFANMVLRITILIKFVVVGLGIAGLLGLPPVRNFLSFLGSRAADGFNNLASQMPGPSWLHNVLAGLLVYAVVGAGSSLFFMLFLVGHALLKKTRISVAVGWATGILWLLTEIACALPLVIVLILEYFVNIVEFRRWLFSERRRGHKTFRFALNYWLSSFARWPNKQFEKVVTPDSFWAGIERALDSQLAFFDMQRRGVTSAFLAGEAVAQLAKLPRTANARLHLAGHSFGGLLVVNVARELARATDNSWGSPPPVESLCTIEGAYASGWLGIEPKEILNVQNTIATVFSEADTATGFYYPAANAGRLAAGSVGFSGIKDANGSPMPMATPEQPCRYGCEQPHIHRPLPYASLADPPVLQGKAGERAIFNIDASKMIYEGPPLSGGGHTDIYKDDVILLLWAVMHRREMITRWPPPKPPEPQPVNAR